tara:strand:+ start:252 stop:536 length:285 start_codon:yes stop_codon:yes gene_type:complete
MKNVIVKEIAQILKVPDKKALNIVETIFSEVKQGIAREESVTLRGFGSFHAIHKRERIGRNPKTGEDAVISARRVTTFKASKKFKAKVNDSISS